MKRHYLLLLFSKRSAGIRLEMKFASWVTSWIGMFENRENFLSIIHPDHSFLLCIAPTNSTNKQPLDASAI
jgi:hypothetical protein